MPTLSRIQSTRTAISMQLAMIGLGRMGGSMARRLRRDGHTLVLQDRDASLTTDLAREIDAHAAGDLSDAIRAIEPPRIVWVMVPAGAPTEAVIREAAETLEAGDILIDGGNSHFEDSRRRANELAQAGVHFLDVGTSGGIWGEEGGYCLMIGGDPDAFAHCEPIFASLAPAEGYARIGDSGAGHLAKMVHNGIEYGLMQAYAEGFELLRAAAPEAEPDVLARLWNRGSVIRSWLLELAEAAFQEEGADLSDLRGWVDDSGEGRWTVQTAVDHAVPLPVISLALMARFQSRQDDSYAARLTAALRARFGGHAVRQVTDEADNG